MLRTLTSTLGAAALMLALPGSPLDAQGKGKGNDKGNDRAQAAETRGGAKGKAERAEAPRAREDRGKPADVADKRGRSDDLNRGRARAAEVREVGGAVAGPAEMAGNAKGERKAFKSSMKSSRFFRAFDSDDTPEVWRGYALSDRLPERYVGRIATLALARGVPQDAIVLRSFDDRVVITNPSGVVLLDLDDQRARNLGAWRVVALHDDDDDREGSPAFCRSGAGHPNWGRQWCVDKGFGLGSDNDRRWGRAVSVQDVVLRRTNTTGDLTRDVLASVLGDVVFNRLAAHAITLGLVDPLVGRWAVEPAGRRVLLVNSGTVPIAEVVDSNEDDRADVLLVALKPW